MLSLKKHCLICKKCIPDPDSGYGCGKDHWDWFGKESEKCPYFEIDEDYIRNEIERQIKRLKGERQ